MTVAPITAVDWRKSARLELRDQAGAKGRTLQMGEATTTEDPKSGASCGPLLMNTFETLAAGSCRHPVFANKSGPEID
jgi:hypothetical protein